jgi:hypothetical protein
MEYFLHLTLILSEGKNTQIILLTTNLSFPELKSECGGNPVITVKIV